MTARWAGTRQFEGLRGARVDWQVLCFDLLAACRERHVTLTQAGNEMGVNVSTLSRLRRHGVPLSVEALASLIAWLYPEAIPAWVKAFAPQK